MTNWRIGTLVCLSRSTPDPLQALDPVNGESKRPPYKLLAVDMESAVRVRPDFRNLANPNMGTPPIVELICIDGKVRYSYRGS